jgi:hypothetical protein
MATGARAKKIKLRPYLRTLFICLVALLIACVWALDHFVINSPGAVWNGMLSNSLKTTSFTDKISENQTYEISTQYVTLETGGNNLAAATTILDDNGSRDGVPLYEKTQSIGTTSADYARYVDVYTSTKKSNGKLYNFKSILGVWGVDVPGSSGSNSGELFNEAVLQRVIPIAYLPAGSRSSLLKFIKTNNVYNVSKAIKRQNSGGREQYVYSVSLSINGYREMMFDLCQDVGLSCNINPYLGNVDATSVPDFKATVDVLSRQLVGIKFDGSSLTETYSAYGARIPIKVPSKYIPITQLEANLESAQ